MKNKLLSMLRTIGKHIVSIRFTAVIMILAASVVPLLAVRGIVVSSFLERQIKQLETKLLNTGNILSADIGKSGYFDRQYDDRINAQVEQLSYMYSGRIVVVASNYNVVKDTYVDQENKTLVSYEVNQAFHGIVTSSYDSKYGIIEITQPIYSSNGNNIIGVLMFAVPDTSIRENVRYIERFITSAIDVTFTVMVLVALAYAFGISRPFIKLAEAIHGMTSG